MTTVRNILFIMADQLRYDYLGCGGHPYLETPNIDALAASGTRFTNAYVQSAICGPSRMSFYTGRYVTSHGSTWNQVPLDIGCPTLGDYLRAHGLNVALAGKTHMAADLGGMKRLGVDPDSIEGVRAAQAGFDPYVRDDGLHPDKTTDPDLAYNRFLRSRGYDGDNPWHDWANSAEDGNGEILSGWYMRNCARPARVRAEDSETPWMTDNAIDFIREMGDTPWCLHLSYIKPHWPYMAPEPYFSMYGPDDILPVNRDDAEREAAHPVMRAFMEHEEGRSFAREEVRRTVIPPYMGLIRQIDDEIGRLMAALEAEGRLDDTLIVFTSDHGDYLGDHWLGEKELFHDPSVRIPLIVKAPGAPRGIVSDAMVEAIDLIPTFLDALGGEIPSHRLEGESLLPLIQGSRYEARRNAVFSELDFSHRKARLDLKLGVNEARAWMVFDGRWKYIHHLKFAPQLFDLENDPLERIDRAADPAVSGVLAEMKERLFQWMATRKVRVTLSDDAVEARTDAWIAKGVIFGLW